MPRPRKCRRVCCLPANTQFAPAGNRACRPLVVLTVDEYEAIRLIDLEGLTQEECAEKMRVARGTVQAIYAVARKKLADMLVHGKILRIEGGDYNLCDGGPGCGQGCRRGDTCGRCARCGWPRQKEQTTE